MDFQTTREYLEQGSYKAEIPLQERLAICAKQLRLSVDHQGEAMASYNEKTYGQYLKGIRNKKLEWN